VDRRLVEQSVALGKKYQNPPNGFRLNVVYPLALMLVLHVDCLFLCLYANDPMCAGSLPDYDDLVRDSQEDVTMEDANRMLNEEDEPEITVRDKCSGSKTSDLKIEKRGETGANPKIRPVPKRADCGEGEMSAPNLPRSRLDSAASNVSSMPTKSDTLPSLYFSTAKAREAAAPPRMLGGGNDPSQYWRFGALSDDTRHSQAFHRHLYETTQNISTSFDPKDLTCHACVAPHPLLARAGGALV
jgi:hypothetical protein